MDKFDYIKLKNSVHQKSQPTINRVKSQPMEWENIFSNHLTNKRLTYKIYKEVNLDIKNTKGRNKG